MPTLNELARGALAAAAGLALSASVLAADLTGADAGANFKVSGMAPDLLDQTHKNAWPITSATYALAYETGADAARQKDIVDFFAWSLKSGQKMASELGFVPLPPNVVKMVEAEMRKIR